MWLKAETRPSSVIKPYLTTSNPTIASCSKTPTMATAKTVEESDVGIFCYISQFPGFRGILKQRSSVSSPTPVLIGFSLRTGVLS
uniref:Multisubstrate pseudouridine synthase 7 isoform X1 n=1 Tax=Rhizophora mucronata TaxID=61149 RepID=A0A2P2LGW6_RHIMU